jgi:hypothetical protein
MLVKFGVFADVICYNLWESLASQGKLQETNVVFHMQERESSGGSVSS